MIKIIECLSNLAKLCPFIDPQSYLITCSSKPIELKNY